MRKCPQLWDKFTPQQGHGLHKLQLNLGWKGARMLKKGGLMVYSTCSFNPIENEAVVAQLLRLSKGALRLVDCKEKLAGLERRGGKTKWKVFNLEKKWNKDYYENPSFWDSFEQVDEKLKDRYHFSFFPPSPEEYDELKLERCLRLFPHLQNTGGFFVSLLEKVSDLPHINGSLTLNPLLTSTLHTSNSDSSSKPSNQENDQQQVVPSSSSSSSHVNHVNDVNDDVVPPSSVDPPKQPKKNNKGNQQRDYKEMPFIKYESENSKEIS